MFTIKEGTTQTIQNWKVIVKKYYESSKPSVDRYEHTDTKGGAPSALVSVSNTNFGNIDTVKGWISCGSVVFGKLALQLNFDFWLIIWCIVGKRSLGKLLDVGS